MSVRILLIATEEAAVPVAAELRRELDAEVEVAPERRMVPAKLRQREYALMVVDESLSAGGMETLEAMYRAAEATPMVEANFAISSASRIVRQVRAALQRRAQDYASARMAATADLRSELNGSLAGLLLESELALRAATPETEPKLRVVVGLATDLRERLRA